MMKIFTALLAFLLMQAFVASAQVNYNDVAVIVNQNDSVSMAIGNYFMQQRNIPAINKITVDVPADEEVSDSIFTAMRHQVENYITSNSLTSTLNYLVTTKGCPLKVLRFSNDTNNCNSSVESELMLILGPRSNTIGNCLSSQQYNPYYNKTYNFSHALTGLYLVTRLDGYTKQEVFTMIDRSGPNCLVSKSSSLFVFDQDPAWVNESLNKELATADSILSARGWQVLLNTDTVFITHQSNVLGYHSWGSNDSHDSLYATNAKPVNSWLPGSIAETNVSTSGRSFQSGTTYGQSLIADLIAEGVSGAKGYVYEPFTIAIARPKILWDRYTDLDASGHPKYNLAESFFSASQMIGWKDVVIGDPKTSITTDSAFLAVSTLTEEKMIVFPNPVGKELRIKNSGTGTGTFYIYNVVGKLVLKTEIESPKPTLTIDVSALTPGIYFAHSTSGTFKKLVKFIKE